jgi:hypothetical protein
MADEEKGIAEVAISTGKNGQFLYYNRIREETVDGVTKDIVTPVFITTKIYGDVKIIHND